MKDSKKDQALETEEQQSKPAEPAEGNTVNINELPEAEDPQTLSEKEQDIEQNLMQLQQEKDALFNRLLRQQADFENYRRRVQDEQVRRNTEAISQFAAQLLPVVDNLERALQAAGSGNTLSKGVEMVYRQLMQIFKEVGIIPLESVGQPFDPRFHQAVQTEEQEDTPPGTVLEEYQKGYIYNEKVIRPSMVKVAG